MQKVVLLCFLAGCLIQVSFGTLLTQSVGIRGRLRCGNRPAANVQVKLVDEDTGPDPDDLLDNKFTDSDGRFNLTGNTREASTIDPRFKIYHNCNDGITPCERKFTFEIPDKYVYRARRVEWSKYFDFGELNLEVKMDHDESRDCIHF